MQRVAFQYIILYILIFSFMVLSCFSPEHVQKHLCKHGFLTKTRPFSTQHSGGNAGINKIIALLWTKPFFFFFFTVVDWVSGGLVGSVQLFYFLR